MITRLLLAVGVAILAMDIHSMAQDLRRLRELAERS